MKFHPACAVLSFLVFLTGLIFTTNPLYGGVLLIFFSVMLIRSSGMEEVWKVTRIGLFYVIIGSAVNVISSSNGSTVLFRSHRIPVIGRVDATLEELIFSFNMGIRIIAMFMLMGVYSKLIDPDDSFDFFSKWMRKLTLTVSLISNMMHNLGSEIERISNVMKLRGVDFSQKNLFERARNFYFMAKVVIISSLEGSIDYSQAIYSKGYPSKYRTSYSEVRFSRKDTVLFALTVVNVMVTAWTYKGGYADYSFYPKLERITSGDIYASLGIFAVAAFHFIFWRCNEIENI